MEPTITLMMTLDETTVILDALQHNLQRDQWAGCRTPIHGTVFQVYVRLDEAIGIVVSEMPDDEAQS